MNTKIQDAINNCKIAQQTERYEDMVKYAYRMVQIVRSQKLPLTEECVKLFSNAYKCKINSRRTAWRALQILSAKEINTKNRSSYITNFYKENIEKQIREISYETISTVEILLKTQKLKMTDRLQLYKTKADFHRYICEISKDPEQLKKLQKECQGTYKKAIDQMKSQEKRQSKQGKEKRQLEVPPHDPRRLAIYLNLSVFYYQIMVLLPRAIETCEQGFNSALENISDLQDPKYIDAVTIMQLMHDNITAWRAEKDKK